MPTSITTWALRTVVAAIAFSLIAINVRTTTEARIYQQVRNDVASSTQPISKPDSLNQWINKLAFYESGNRADIKILDVNNKYSYGCLQFQMATWIGMGNKYGFQTTPENIYDCRLQKQLAHAMLSDRWNNWHHWGYTVNVRMKVWPPRV